MEGSIGGKTLESKEGLVLSLFKISQRDTLNCSRPNGSKAGNDKSKEGKADGGIEFCVLAIFDLFLLYLSRTLDLFLFLLFADVQVPCKLTSEIILISATAWDRG